jgi:hypothetical protein
MDALASAFVTITARKQELSDPAFYRISEGKARFYAKAVFTALSSRK